MSDVLTLADVRAAVELLRANARPVEGGFYLFPVHPSRLGDLLLFAWEENLRRRWAAEERAVRGGGS